MTEKQYNRQRATIIAIIIIAIVLMLAAVVGIIIFANNTKPIEAGNDVVTVENYIGKRYDELSSKDITLEKVEVFSKEEKGVVIQQSIAEGTSVKKGTVVTLNVSKGDSEVAVPSVVGKTEDEAVKALRDNGFEVVVHYILNLEGDEKGMVYECSPKVGDKVSYGSKVTIKVWGDDLMVTTTTTTTKPTESTNSTRPTTPPTTEPTTESTTQPVTEPTTESTTQPVTEPTTEAPTTTTEPAPTEAPVAEQTQADE